jgi:MFS family permease
MLHYVLSLFGPPLIAEFGWERSEFALVSSLSVMTLFVAPFAGRFVDRVGARTAGIVGFTVVPLCYLAFSFMTGNIFELYAITLVKNVFGILTTSIVFCRVVVERFDTARGMALSVAMTGPPLIGAIATPIIGEIIDSEGWRAGYRTLAALSAVGGLLALTLIGFRKRVPGGREAAPLRRKAPRLTRGDILAIVRRPTFMLLVGGMFLVNIPQVIVSSQLKLVLLDNGAVSDFATWLVSLYAISVIIGRFACGYALDRIEPQRVAVVTLGLPALGLFAMATPFDASWVLFGAVLLMGLAQGAEGDVGAVLTSRRFEMEHYSFIYSFLIAAMGAAASVGSIVLSLTLHRTDSYDGFLIVSAVATLLGVLCFCFIGGSASGQREPAAPAPQSA